MDLRKPLLVTSVALFLLWTLVEIMNRNYQLLFDRLLALGVSFLALLYYTQMRVRHSTIILGFILLIAHNTLAYDNTFFGIAFERYIHFFAAFTLSILFYDYIYATERRKNRLKLFFFSALVSIGIASLMEIVEFIGYSFLGEGKGILFYGTGDFGEWNNVSWDLISNTLGAFAGSFYSSFRNKGIPSLVAVFIGLMLITTPHIHDNPYSQVIDDADIPRERYIGEIDSILRSDVSGFVKGDALLIKGRLLGDRELICSSVDHYKSFALNASPRMKALTFETIASLDCPFTYSSSYLGKAAEIWEEMGYDARARIDREIASGDFDPEFRPYDLHPPVEMQRPLLVGNSTLVLKEGELLLSQVDRVTRDWLSAQLAGPYSDDLLEVFSEKYSLNSSDLMPDIGWHEGARIKEMLDSGIKHMAAAGTLCARIDGTWYASDEHGTFRFEIPDDKLSYPTVRYLADDLAIMIDTHGINMLVWQAVRQDADAVVGCCDHIGKVKAASYLADKGIKVICLTDRLLPEIVNTPRSDKIIGSAPFDVHDDKVVFGGRPVKIDADNILLTTDVGDDPLYALFYYDAPSRYFDNLGIVHVSYNITGFGQMDLVVEEAEQIGADILAARIYNTDDYKNVKRWLEGSELRKAILFHSVSYPYGYRLFKEFPERTSFGDINPSSLP